MKSLISKLVTPAIALFIAAAMIQKSHATKVTLDGYGSYLMGSKVTYYRSAPKQSGRYNSLGKDYYHSISYTMDFITNRSNSKSGSLSYEFWAMPFYGADSGIILMTRNLKPMAGGLSVKYLTKTGLGVFLDTQRFPEMNLWEFTSKGWKFRDALSFPRKIWL